MERQLLKHQVRQVWATATIGICMIGSMVALMPWKVPEQTNIASNYPLANLSLGFHSEYEPATDRYDEFQLYTWKTGLRVVLTPESSFVIPNIGILLALVLIGGIAGVRGLGVRGRWLLLLQFGLATYGLVHMWALLILMSAIGLDLMLPGLLGFAFLVLLLSALFLMSKKELEPDTSMKAVGKDDQPAIADPVDNSAMTSHQAALRAVGGPAIGLILVSVINLLPLVFAALSVSYFTFDPAPPDPSNHDQAVPIPTSVPGPPIGLLTQIESGSGASAASGASQRVALGTSLWLGMGTVTLLFSIPLAVAIFLGGWKMRQLELYPMAIAASVLAMLPCQLGFLVGLPVGIWSLVILNRKDIKDAFASQAGLLPGEAGQKANGHDSKTALALDQDVEQIRSRLRGPGILFVVMGGINIGVSLIIVAMGLIAVLRGVMPGSMELLIIALLIVPSIIWGAFMILGGLNLQRVRSYELAFACAIAALIPIGPTWVLNVGAGIWALVVLKDPAVKQSFK